MTRASADLANGTELIETYLEGLSTLPRSVALETTVVFGPQMPTASRSRLLSRFGTFADVSFVDFDPDLASRYASADVVVSMAGYNTVSEILSLGKKALIVPRSGPSAEQRMRVRLLAERGLIDTIEPESLSPRELADRLLRDLERDDYPAPDETMDTRGAERAAARLLELVHERAFAIKA